MTLLQAIAHIEGYYAAPSPAGTNRPQRNFNPGDLDFEPWMGLYGGKLETIPAGYNEAPRYAAFPTTADGFAALHALLSSSAYVDLTIEAAITKYAPPVENNTMNYVDYVCAKVGCEPTDLVGKVLAEA